MLAYITYGNIASNIAHQLNMRQTGYKQAVNMYYNGGSYRFPQVFSYKVEQSGKYAETYAGQYLDQSQVVCYPDTVYLRAGTYFALDITGRDGTLNMVGDQFIIPYVQVNEIKVETSQGSTPKALTFSPGISGASSAANIIVHVSITYNVLNPFGTFNWYRTDGGSSLIRITSNGYDVIS